MRTHHCPGFHEYPLLDTDSLRGGYLLEDLFLEGEICLVYTDMDRAIVGSAVPLSAPLSLDAGPQLRADFFCERRELGILNIGGAGTVTVDGSACELANFDCLYVGRGARNVVFGSADAGAPARFYLLSYPAHTSYPTVKATPAEANKLVLGSVEEANSRHLYQYIHENGIRSCQLVMGFTELQPGGVWNTMPPHTHDRRSEVYLYFDLVPGQRVAHFMGDPEETRVLWVGEKQSVLSPPWSIHCGAGTAAYRFIWGMGGENQRFDDMDKVAVADLK